MPRFRRLTLALATLCLLTACSDVTANQRSERDPGATARAPLSVAEAPETPAAAPRDLGPALEAVPRHPHPSCHKIHLRHPASTDRV